MCKAWLSRGSFEALDGWLREASKFGGRDAVRAAYQPCECGRSDLGMTGGGGMREQIRFEAGGERKGGQGSNWCHGLRVHVESEQQWCS